MKKLIILLIILLLCQFAFAIIDNKSYVNALQYYEMGNYIAAKNSLDLIQAPDNQSPEFALLRGKVFLATGDFKQAHLWLAEYGKYSLGSEALAREDLLNMIYEASLYQEQSPIAVALGKLKGNINSSDPEYAPVITPDGRGMYYSSLRRDVFKQENIFYSTMSNNVWQEPITVKELCTDKNESLGSISVDGQTAYLFGYYQNNNTNGDIYKSILSNGRWTKPAIIAEVSSPFYDLQPFVWKDQVMFLTSNRQGNNDNYDLFVSEFVGGYWTQPVSLGEAINTPYDEQSPFLSDDGKYLYFASRGFSSFGGNDIFVAERIGKSWTEWSTPQNMGPIINSVKDDRYFFISPDNQIAYLTSNRGGGMGQEDIYFIDLGLLQLVKDKIAMANAPKGEDGRIITTPSNLGDVLKISGVVVDENNRPVKTDIVWTYVFYDSVYMRVIPTDEMGLFSFHLPITANGISYEINAPGYRKTEGSIEVPPDKNEVFVNITCVTDPESTTGGNIALNGKVLDENNKSVECIIRWAYVYNGELNEVLVEAGKDGSFKLYIPKVTKVKYKIEEPKYAVREEILTLPEGIDSYSVIIRLVSLGNDIVLSGKVTDENDAPLVADVFWVYSKNNETVEYRVLSNVDGSYTVTLPRLARISYKVAKPNYMQISGDLDVPGNQREVTKDFRLVKLAEETVFQLENVQFEFAKAILTPESIKILEPVLETMKANVSLEIELSGHTDIIGGRVTNQKLSEACAAAVANFLITNGIDTKRISTIGYGFDKPIATNETAEGRTKNRRTELKILGIDYMQDQSDAYAKEFEEAGKQTRVTKTVSKDSPQYTTSQIGIPAALEEQFKSMILQSLANKKQANVKVDLFISNGKIQSANVRDLMGNLEEKLTEELADMMLGWKVQSDKRSIYSFNVKK